MLRGIVATEELIGQKISARAKTSEQATRQRSSSVNKEAQESGLTDVFYNFTMNARIFVCWGLTENCFISKGTKDDS